MKKRMIIIGANGSAYKRTIPALRDSDICEIIAIQSRNEEKLKKACHEYKIATYYTDIKEILENEDYDLIYIANPPFMHKETIEQCIQYNKPIICEKPLARNYKEGLEILNIVNNYKHPIMVAHHLRHQKAYNDIKNMLKINKIGQVVSVWGQWGFHINVDAPSSKWKLDKQLGGGGTMSDNGIHVVDFIIGLFGRPTNVIGNSRKTDFPETYSNETMMLIYDDKDITINSSHTMPKAGNHLLIYGTNGNIEVLGGMSEKSIKKIVITTDVEETIEYDDENLYKNEVENFIRCNLLNDVTVEKGTSVEEQLISLQSIDRIRDINVR